MKRVSHSHPRLLTTCVVLVVTLAAFAKPAFATDFRDRSISGLRGTLTFYLQATKHGGDNIFFKGVPSKIDNLKSSNAKVVTAGYRDGRMYPGVILLFSKTGKSTITYKYKGKNYKAKVVVKKYSNPVKSFKFDEAEYKSKFNRGVNANADSYEIEGSKVKVVPAKGWKLKGITAYTDNGKAMKTKNGKALPKGSTSVEVDFQNKSTKGYQTLLLVPKGTVLSTSVYSYYTKN